MPKGNSRVPEGINDFNSHINSVFAYIMLASTPPVGGTNGSRIGWLPDEIAQVIDIHSRWQPLILLYTDKKGERTTLIKDSLLLLIKEYRDLNRSNNLYNRVAVSLNATLKDFEIFNIKAGTPLASVTHTKTAETGTKTVGIMMKKSGHLFHELLVTNPDQKGRAKEDGVKEIMFFKAVGLATAVAPDMSAFHYVGDVVRGTIVVNHDSETIGMKAWYYACVKNSKGELGIPSEIVGFIIT